MSPSSLVHVAPHSAHASEEHCGTAWDKLVLFTKAAIPMKITNLLEPPTRFLKIAYHGYELQIRKKI